MHLDGNIRHGQCDNWFKTGSRNDIDSGFRAGELSNYSSSSIVRQLKSDFCS
jgi:hypothetical protein